MKVPNTVVLCAVLFTVASAQGLGTCGGSCTSSAICAVSGGDSNCRCVNNMCTITQSCGGSCLLDGQCANWAGGDTNCICRWFSCTDAQKRIAHAPGYHPFVDFAMLKMNKMKREEVEAIKEE